MATAVAVRPVELELPEQASLWSDAWRRLKRNRLALVATFYLIFLVAVALIAIVWTPYRMSAIGVGPTYAPPSAAHPMGLDSLGRDILSRLMVGAQVSLIVGIGTQMLVVAVGVPIGLAAGYYRGWFDNVVSFIINVFYGIPDVLLAMILVFLLGPSLTNIIVAIVLTRWMDMARLVRGQAMSLREREFVEAGKASGAKPLKMLFGHLLPNSLGPIIVQATLGIPAAILFEAFLSFLGVGVQPPTPSWGSMAADGVRAIEFAPHIVVFPSLALAFTLVAFNFLGDGLRDALDPRGRR
jgi:ABC-type dipeptide/oligopeptide/nickel transport system permease subunit